MMPHELETDSLPALKFGARQHCRNSVENAIRDTDHPLSWDDCNHVEALMMAEFEQMIANLTVELLRNLRYMTSLIDQIVAETVRLLKAARRQRT